MTAHADDIALLDPIGGRLAGLEQKLNLLTWMVGGVYAVIVILGAPALWLLLRVAAKVGALG